ncbi:hypothetical protein [Haloferax sp. DFSO52]|uniref:hypothetical protein n=1 Tax=Haloferax sp. DFSO52 TaxID=3388505 RepID=UPI003A86246B
MTTFNISRWLLVVLAIVGLAFAVPVVSAHGNGTAAGDAPPYDGTATEWTAWMESHMNDHMGPGAVEWMESHMGMTVEEMGQDMAENGRMTGHGGMNGYSGMGGGGHC